MFLRELFRVAHEAAKALAAVLLFAFEQTVAFDFTNFIDGEQPHIRRLVLDGLARRLSLELSLKVVVNLR